MAERWTPNTWRSKPVKQMPVYADQAKLAAAEQRLSNYPPLVFAGEARRLKRLLADVAERQGLPAAGRRLRRELQGVPRRQHPRHLPPDAADGGGADLRRRQAGGEGRPHGRPVRQAALGADRDHRRRRPCRPTAATSSTAWISTPRRARPTRERLLQAYNQSAATLNLLRAFAGGGYADLHNVHRWTLGFVERQPAGRALPRAGRQDRRGAELHGGLRRHRETTPQLHQIEFFTSHEALLLRFEEAMTRVDSTYRRLVRHLRPPAVDRRAHPPARRRPCRVPARHQEPDRPEVRPDHGARTTCCA